MERVSKKLYCYCQQPEGRNTSGTMEQSAPTNGFIWNVFVLKEQRYQRESGIVRHAAHQKITLRFIVSVLFYDTTAKVEQGCTNMYDSVYSSAV